MTQPGGEHHRARRFAWWTDATVPARRVTIAQFVGACAAVAVAIPLMPGERTLRWWIVLPLLWVATTLSMRRATTAGIHRGGREVLVIPVGQYFFAAAMLLDPVWIAVLAVCVPTLRLPPRSIGVRCQRVITMTSGSAAFWLLLGSERLSVAVDPWRMVGAAVSAMCVHILVETMLVSITVHFMFGTSIRDTNVWNAYSLLRDGWELAIGAVGALLALMHPVYAVLVIPVAALAVEHIKLERDNALVRRDPGTDLLNVRGFHELSAHELQRAADRGSPITLLLLDLDHLREVNNLHGHRAGDAVISEVGRRLLSLARAEDVVARVGGEEFVALLPDATLADAALIAERIRAAVTDEPITTPDGPVGTSVSIGAAQWNETESLDELFDRADAAMYAAKQAGRNQVVLAP